MTARFVLSPRAQSDLDAIWDYSLRQWGAEQAAAYLRQIEQSTRAIAANPLIGRACDDIRPGYCRFRSGTHLLFYRIIEDGVDIIRILHASMHAQAQLDEG